MMIETTFAISEPEFAEAQKMWCPAVVKKLPGRIPYLTIIFSLAALIGWTLHNSPVGYQLAIGFFLIALVVVSKWRKKAITKYQYSLNAERYKEVRAKIDDSGYFDHRPDESNSWLAWSLITGWLEGKTVFVLGMNLNFITIPKRALSSEQQDELRATLRARFNPVS
ncbi:MAG: YcxB family protein [Acidobacteriota bacterium]|nr:YcxB family protein [Acidobacteriota bacterium]